MTDAKIIKVYCKDSMIFSGPLISLDDSFLKLHDIRDDKDITIPILNVARWTEEKQ